MASASTYYYLIISYFYNFFFFFETPIGYKFVRGQSTIIVYVCSTTHAIERRAYVLNIILYHKTLLYLYVHADQKPVDVFRLYTRIKFIQCVEINTNYGEPRPGERRTSPLLGYNIIEPFARGAVNLSMITSVSRSLLYNITLRFSLSLFFLISYEIHYTFARPRRRVHTVVHFSIINVTNNPAESQ